MKSFWQVRARGLGAFLALVSGTMVGLAATSAGLARPDAPPVYVRKGTWAETMEATRANYLRTATAKTAEPLPTSFQPYDSGPIAGSASARHVSLNVAGLKVLRLMATCEKAVANCNIWGEPRLFTRDGTETRLTQLKPTLQVVGWGQVLVNTNWQGHPLRIGDRTLAFGFWVHANSELQFALEGKYERFEVYAGEDWERTNGMARFQVLSEGPAALPAFWGDLSRDFPVEAGWFLSAAGNNDLAAWFAKRDAATVELNILGRFLDRFSPADRTFRDDLSSLAEAKAPPGDKRWLDLCARVNRYGECAALLNRSGTMEERASWKTELAALAAAKVAPDDPRWLNLRSRAMQCEEIESQFESLRQDLVQRAKFAKLAPETFRADSLILDSDRDPADVVVRRTAALLADLKSGSAAPKLGALEKQFAALQKTSVATAVTNAPARRALFDDACKLRRQIAFSNPLLNFDQLLFLKRHRAIFQHMCDQFYGICAAPGGGLYVLSDPFGANPQVRDVLAKSTVENGRLQGQQLSGGPVVPPKLSYDGVGHLKGENAQGGSFLSPSLSYDGKTILFAYVECQGDKDHRDHTDATRGHWDERRSYHIFKVNADGSHLRQITDGTWNDFDPCWLPNGRVAFITERRGGYLRCGRVCPLYNLYDMAADGSDMNCLSFHESNEWHPTVTHDGRIIYTRWDYVDRYGCTAHAPWFTKLDGTDARALHGNYSVRSARPDMELNVRAIPGSTKYIATAAPHHGQAFGSLVVIDPQVADDDGMGPIKRFTPEVAFPETQAGREVYGTAWPLSEDYHLCVYDADMQYSTGKKRGPGNYGIYLVDSFGNKELIYRDPAIGCLSPVPLRPTALPTVAVANSLAATKTESVSPGHTGEATMAVVNAYDSLLPWPAGTKIKEIRIFQVLPMSVPSGAPPHNTGKRIAGAEDSVVPARWVLGTVPVEADGSAHFKVPAYRELFFQAIDERGLAIQSMRSATYVRQGERLVCQGCHEPKSHASAPPATVPLALRRAPSTPQPDVDGSNPFSYPRLVQPVLDRNCVKCHEENQAKKAPNLAREPIQNKWFASYNSLIKYGFTSYGGGYRTIPGKFGARASKLVEMLDKGHHDVKLAAEDFHRLTLWLDSASMFYGVFEKEGGESQLAGGIPKPTLE